LSAAEAALLLFLLLLLLLMLLLSLYMHAAVKKINLPRSKKREREKLIPA
jgi:hypothetical protein